MSSADEQGEIFPTHLTLRRIDLERNMRRFYLMQVQLDLFGGASLIREWGRIGTRGRVLVEHHPDEGGAVTSLPSMARSKARRGYGT